MNSQSRSPSPPFPSQGLLAQPVTTNWWLTCVASLWMALNIMGFALVSFLVKGYGPEISRRVTIPFRVFCTGLSVWLLFMALRNRSRFPRLWYLWIPIVLFWSVYIWRLLQDTAFNPVPLGMAPADYYAWIFGCCIPTFLAGMSIRDRSAYRWAPWMTLVMGMLVCIMGILYNMGSDIDQITRRSGNVILNPILYGHAGVLTFTLGLLASVKILPKPRHVPELLFLIPMGLGLYTLFLSVSRGPLICLVITTVLIVSSLTRVGIWYRILMLAPLALLVIPDIINNVIRQGVEVGHYYGSVGAFTSGESAQGRIDFFQTAWQQFLSSPFLGDSLELKTYLIYPHNVIIEALMATGLVGGISYIAIVLLGLRNALRTIFRDAPYAFLGVFYVHALVGAMFSGGLAGDPFTWMILGVGLILIPVARGERTEMVGERFGMPVRRA